MSSRTMEIKLVDLNKITYIVGSMGCLKNKSNRATVEFLQHCVYEWPLFVVVFFSFFFFLFHLWRSVNSTVSHCEMFDFDMFTNH